MRHRSPNEADVLSLLKRLANNIVIKIAKLCTYDSVPHVRETKGIIN